MAEKNSKNVIAIDLIKSSLINFRKINIWIIFKQILNRTHIVHKYSYLFYVIYIMFYKIPRYSYK